MNKALLTRLEALETRETPDSERTVVFLPDNHRDPLPPRKPRDQVLFYQGPPEPTYQARVEPPPSLPVNEIYAPDDEPVKEMPIMDQPTGPAPSTRQKIKKPIIPGFLAGLQRYYDS